MSHLPTSSLELTKKHGYVLLVGCASVLVHNFWMSYRVGAARKKYKVWYPAAYAPSGHPGEREFNCTQRAHQNSLENLPSFYAMLFMAGAKYPTPAAVAGTVYLLGRILYFQGYSTGKPKGRLRGIPGVYAGSFALLGMAAWWALKVARGSP